VDLHNINVVESLKSVAKDSGITTVMTTMPDGTRVIVMLPGEKDPLGALYSACYKILAVEERK
jgi:hypothetical protein